MTDMINLRAALACEYAANSLRAAHTFESAHHIYGTDTSVAVAARSGDGIDNLRQAAELLGFTITPITRQVPDSRVDGHVAGHDGLPTVVTGECTAKGGHHVNASITPNSERVPSPQTTAPVFQDIDSSRSDYSNGLSGRAA